MRVMLTIATAALLAFPVHAQGPTIVDACLKAASLQLGHSDLEATNIQSFPELSPPRVRMDVTRTVQPSGNRIADILNNAIDGTSPDDFTRAYGEVRCEFESPVPPFGLAGFVCFATGCGELYMGRESQHARLEELQVLLAREGY